LLPKISSNPAPLFVSGELPESVAWRRKAAPEATSITVVEESVTFGWNSLAVPQSTSIRAVPVARFLSVTVPAASGSAPPWPAKVRLEIDSEWVATSRAAAAPTLPIVIAELPEIALPMPSRSVPDWMFVAPV